MSLSPLEIAIACARMSDNKRFEDILVLNVSRQTTIADYFVLATAHNKRQMSSLAAAIKQELKNWNVTYYAVEGKDSDFWILIDLGSCIVQLFSEEGREYYGLENLWIDADKVQWQNSGKIKPVDQEKTQW